MIVDQVVNNVDLALFHANMMRQMRSLNPQANMDALLTTELPSPFVSHYYPATANAVAVYVGGNSNRKIAYFDGIANASQGTALIGGYSRNLGLTAILGPNTWIEASLPYYLDLIAPGRQGASENFDLVGYSAGGAVATAVAYRLKLNGNLQKKKLITFGAPRPGGPNVRDQLSMFPVARWMTNADPIPLVPPRLQDAPQFAAAVPIGVMVSWSNMVHTQGGIVVNPDGTTNADVDPPTAAMTPGTALADWMFGLESGGNNPHAITTYAAYLLEATKQYDTPRTKTRDVAPREDQAEDRKGDVNKQRDRVVTAMRVAQHQQNSVVVNQPAIVLFRPQRMGRLWAVVFGDKVVAQGVREDTCRHLCRAGNDFLRSLPKQGLVDPITLAAQFESFLAFATAPESDWLPKLQTNLQL